ncbi:MAG: hypothetical protein ACPG4T_20330, partial [Nannocystaceae bacterium]
MYSQIQTFHRVVLWATLVGGVVGLSGCKGDTEASGTEATSTTEAPTTGEPTTQEPTEPTTQTSEDSTTASNGCPAGQVNCPCDAGICEQGS